MYAHEKTRSEDLKAPGDWTPSYYATEPPQTTPYGILLICVCGDLIGLSNSVHTIASSEGILDINPSIAHYNNHGGGFKCHYFIRAGEYVQA